MYTMRCVIHVNIQLGGAVTCPPGGRTSLPDNLRVSFSQLSLGGSACFKVPRACTHRDLSKSAFVSGVSACSSGDHVTTTKNARTRAPSSPPARRGRRYPGASVSNEMAHRPSNDGASETVNAGAVGLAAVVEARHRCSNTFPETAVAWFDNESHESYMCPAPHAHAL